MFKTSNTHHSGSPKYMMKLRRLAGSFAGTQDYNANGLDFTTANQTMIFQNMYNIIPQTGPFTLEFYLEINATNKTGDRWFCCFGQVSSAYNHMAFKISAGKPQFMIYGPTGATKTYLYGGSALAEGMHRVAVAYDGASVADVIMCVDGVASTVSGSGTGPGVVTPQVANNFTLGHNSYETAAGTTYKFKGRIKQAHYSPFKRSAADLVRRQSDINKLFPVDKYSVLDWHSGNYLRAWQRPINPSTKYIL